MNEKKPKARDFITIGIFTADPVGCADGYHVSRISVPVYRRRLCGSHPRLSTGIPMMLYYARIEKFGMLTITSVIVAILLSYLSVWAFLAHLFGLQQGVIADLIAKSGEI